MAAAPSSFFPLARLEGPTPLLHAQYASGLFSPDPAWKLRAVVSLARLEGYTLLVVALLGGSFATPCVLMDPTDPGVWLALDKWRARGSLPVRLDGQQGGVEGELPLRIDTFVDASREHLTQAGLPSVRYERLDRYEVSLQLGRLFRVQDVLWRGLEWAGEFVESAHVEQCVRAAVDDFGHRQFAETLTASAQGALGSGAA